MGLKDFKGQKDLKKASKTKKRKTGGKSLVLGIFGY